MMEKGSTIGERFRDFGLSRYASLAEFARALEVGPQTLSPYLRGDRVPGHKMQSKLRDLGCDIEWLMTGKKGSAGKVKEKESAYVAFHAPAGMSVEVRKKLQKLIDDINELEEGDIDRARELIKAAFKKR